MNGFSPYDSISSVKLALLSCALLLLAGCAGLTAFPIPTEHCEAHGSLAELWQCVGKPDLAPKESGLADTLRVANGDLTRRVLLNQSPSLACNRNPWSGFEHISRSFRDADRLEAFVHTGDAAQPVILVIHGLYDSNSNRYVRYVASALADRGFGVVVPDMRWHGCLMSLPSTLGIDESKDLLAWTLAIRDGALIPSLGGRPVGMIGFSLGGLDVIDTMSLPDATRYFDAGAIAVSPPADLKRVLARLDRMRTPIGYYFRSTLRFRNHNLGIPFWAPRPFRAYLDWLVTHHVPSLGSTDGLLIAAEPSQRLADVRRPLLIIASRNDPVLGRVASDALEAAAAPLTYVRVIATEEGGHIGVMGGDPPWFAKAMTTFFTNAGHVAVQP
jgi:predicted alpha/beta-fold hydrolase